MTTLIEHSRLPMVDCSMSALGQKKKCAAHQPLSAKCQIGDIELFDNPISKGKPGLDLRRCHT
jgi:hypothetical protein